MHPISVLMAGNVVARSLSEEEKKKGITEFLTMWANSECYYEKIQPMLCVVCVHSRHGQHLLTGERGRVRHDLHVCQKKIQVKKRMCSKKSD